MLLALPAIDIRGRNRSVQSPDVAPVAPAPVAPAPVAPAPVAPAPVAPESAAPKASIPPRQMSSINCGKEMQAVRRAALIADWGGYMKWSEASEECEVRSDTCDCSNESLAGELKKKIEFQVLATEYKFCADVSPRETNECREGEAIDPNGCALHPLPARSLADRLQDVRHTLNGTTCLDDETFGELKGRFSNVVDKLFHNYVKRLKTHLASLEANAKNYTDATQQGVTPPQLERTDPELVFEIAPFIEVLTADQHTTLRPLFTRFSELLNRDIQSEKFLSEHPIMITRGDVEEVNNEANTERLVQQGLFRAEGMPSRTGAQLLLQALIATGANASNRGSE